MKVKTFYSVEYETDSKEELEQLAEILPPLLLLYNEISVIYRTGFDYDLVFSIDRSDMAISWMDFETYERGEIRFKKLTSGILRKAFANA